MFSREFFLYPNIMEQFNELAIDREIHGLATKVQQPFLMQRPHRHNEIELNYLEAGSMVYLSGGKHIEVIAGQIAVFWAAIPHQLIYFAEGSLQLWITIPFATFLQWRLPDTLTQQVIRGTFVQGTVCTQGQSSGALFRQWYADLQANSSELRKIALLEIEAHLRRLTLSLGDREESATSSPVQELSKVEQIACFIADHYTEPIPIESIAHAVHLHPNYAMNLFRKHLGQSIVDYVTQYRLSHAQRLLIMTNANASEIALEVGFGSVSRFYVAFKRAYKQSPGEYRSMIQRAQDVPEL